MAQVIINVGSGSPGANPSFTYTFPNGASGSAIPITQVTPFGGVQSNWQVISNSATTVGVEFVGTPTASTTIGCNLLLTWPDD